MQTIPKSGGQSLTALIIFCSMAYAERQMPLNPDEMDVERKLFAIATWILGRDTAPDTTWSSNKEI